MSTMRPGDFGIGRLLDRIHDAVVVADADTGRIVLWNPAAEALFGYSAAEALGLPIEVLIPERLKAQHRAGLAQYCATGHGAAIDSQVPLELPAVRKTGEEVAIELSLSPLDDVIADGRLELAIIRDLSERKQVMEAHDVMERKQLEERMRVSET